MSDYTDTAGPVRAGEQLDLGKLEPYLLQHLPDARGPLAVEQFRRGHSNLTYLLRLGDRELVLRRPPFGNVVKTAHDMGREYRVLSKLAPVYPPAPRPFLHCDDESVLGAPFYVMERRRGVILRKDLPPGFALAPEAARRLCEALIDNLAALHALDYKAAGLGDLGRPEGYVGRQVSGWTKRYHDARTDDVPPLERAAAWLAANVPPESGACLIHNDYKHDNVMLDPDDRTRVVAVLDWEMATVGDPLTDLGTTLGYWIEAGDPGPLRANALVPTTLPGSPTRREVVERYAAKSGRDVGAVTFYYCLGLFKIAVIVQQIYARFVRGHTKDERFAGMGQTVEVLGRRAAEVAETGLV